MPYIPPAVSEDNLSREVLMKSLKRIHQGKVRDTYELPGHPDKLLVIATNRLSIFDFVLGRTVPLKGEILTAMTIFWLTDILHDYPHHLIAYGTKMNAFLPKSLQSNPFLQRSGIIVKKLEMLQIECIARGYLTGTGLKAYKNNGIVCGHKLPEGLHDGSKLSPAIFTPTTKALVGHDEHVTAKSVYGFYGEMPERITLEIFDRASAYALARGIILADMKIEMGLDGSLADEVLTPDSCRFWDIGDYGVAASHGKSPSGYDKEPVRQAGKSALINGDTLDLSKLELTQANAEFAGSWVVPNDVISQTTSRYTEIFHRLTGLWLNEFQSDIMVIR